MATALGLVFGKPLLENRKARSTLLIEGFGRIRSAEVEFAPLTILLGKNNSGKSYLAHLIWAARGMIWWPSEREHALHAPKKFKDSIKALDATTAL